jgi:hypothetical protein
LRLKNEELRCSVAERSASQHLGQGDQNRASRESLRLVEAATRALRIASPLSSSDLFKTAHIAVGSFEFDAKGMRAM